MTTNHFTPGTTVVSKRVCSIWTFLDGMAQTQSGKFISNECHFVDNPRRVVLVTECTWDIGSFRYVQEDAYILLMGGGI